MPLFEATAAIAPPAVAPITIHDTRSNSTPATRPTLVFPVIARLHGTVVSISGRWIDAEHGATIDDSPSWRH
jgi:hypothetical protein